MDIVTHMSPARALLGPVPPSCAVAAPANPTPVAEGSRTPPPGPPSTNSKLPSSQGRAGAPAHTSHGLRGACHACHCTPVQSHGAPHLGPLRCHTLRPLGLQDAPALGSVSRTECLWLARQRALTEAPQVGGFWGRCLTRRGRSGVCACRTLAQAL